MALCVLMIKIVPLKIILVKILGQRLRLQKIPLQTRRVLMVTIKPVANPATCLMKKPVQG